jgi:hypothetical protein
MHRGKLRSVPCGEAKGREQVEQARAYVESFVRDDAEEVSA